MRFFYDDKDDKTNEYAAGSVKGSTLFTEPALFPAESFLR